MDQREAQRRSGADPDTAPTRMFLPTDLATAAGVYEALHGAVMGFGVVGVSKPTPKRNVFDSPNRSVVLAALIHGATVYAVGSVDASGAACEELGYELEMHVWQAELARIKLVEELSGYRDRDQVLAPLALRP